MSGVDVSELAALPLGEFTGIGSRFGFRRLDKLLIANTHEEHFGIKLPLVCSADIKRRFGSELAIINFILTTSPELTTNMPRFMALAQVEGAHKPAGIFTEDVSQCGAKDVTEVAASQRVRELLYAPYSNFGTFDEVMSKDDCDNSLAFIVDGEEKLLDLSPPPISIRFAHAPEAYVGMLCEVEELLPELTITIPRDSTLGNTLTI